MQAPPNGPVKEIRYGLNAIDTLLLTDTVSVNRTTATTRCAHFPKKKKARKAVESKEEINRIYYEAM